MTEPGFDNRIKNRKNNFTFLQITVKFNEILFRILIVKMLAEFLTGLLRIYQVHSCQTLQDCLVSRSDTISSLSHTHTHAHTHTHTHTHTQQSMKSKFKQFHYQLQIQ